MEQTVITTHKRLNSFVERETGKDMQAIKNTATELL